MDNLEKRKRLGVRLFVLCLVSILLLDVCPWGVLPSDRPKELLNALTYRAGIWQGQWVMFTPRPSVNHYWLTAGVYDAQGNRLEDWSSPYWPTVPSWEKFLRFRHLNYFNRVSLPKNQLATTDLAEYLSRTVGPVDSNGHPERVRVELHSNNVEMVPLEKGPFPPPEEVVWVTQSKWLATVDPNAEESELPPIP